VVVNEVSCVYSWRRVCGAAFSAVFVTVNIYP
jgi:hypothetical protein